MSVNYLQFANLNFAIIRSLGVFLFYIHINGDIFKKCKQKYKKNPTY